MINVIIYVLERKGHVLKFINNATKIIKLSYSEVWEWLYNILRSTPQGQEGCPLQFFHFVRRLLSPHSITVVNFRFRRRLGAGARAVEEARS